MADYEFETLDEWIEKGSFNDTNFKDVKDSDSKISGGHYYDNYTKTVQDAIDAGNLDKAKQTVEAHGFDWNDPTPAPDDGNGEIVYEPPDRPETPGPDERPDYEGPPYYDPRDFDPTPGYMRLREINDEDFLSNRIANLLRQDGKLFRMFSEAAARKFGNRGPRAQEMMMGEIMKVAKSIGEAEALMLERDRTLHNTAYYKQMDIRMQGAMQQALSHIAGGYQIQATIINDITNQWKAQLAADTQTYGIDVGAETGLYATKLQYALGMKGIDVKMADILSKIEDNAEAASFIWDWIYGDNDLNPSEYHKEWKKKWGDLAETETKGSEDVVSGFKASILNYLNMSNCAAAAQLARTTGNEEYFEANRNKGRCNILSSYG